ncbi:exonuclease RNase T and DNA polymerase III [Paenibacillus sp. FSL R7-269]|uniref:3'-5' exonuclease n=1 Tax=Paenibacillus sp. FSL R7-269 TaxID=1226755 RepID=UPI0003E1CC1A|nr:3'-5' exonuclease [Paenibacillus sp. FSL R7-269]ETT41578.1 exonuclease RNase T and DNA polymerase III [Paenibacillus sp. FSL R7-269]
MNAANEIITVIDVETTGLDHTTDHITEIAAIRAEVSADGSIREIGRFQTYVALGYSRNTPRKRSGSPAEFAVIPPEITELTGIRTEDLHGAPDEFNAVESAVHFAHGSYIVAHNVSFDFAFISRYYKPWYFACTRAMSRLVDPDESAKLADVCARYNVPLNGHHRAMNDVEATLQVYAALRQKADTAGIAYRNVVIDSEERPLKYTPPGAIVRTIKRTEGAA